MDTLIYVYDKARYHPKGGFTHTGMFIGWILENNLYSEKMPIDKSAALSLKERKITGAQIYDDFLDGVLTSNELNDEGNAFAKSYFDFTKGKYIHDYAKVFNVNLRSNDFLNVKDTWNNYEKIKNIIDKRYQEWKERQNRKWWEFWK